MARVGAFAPRALLCQVLATMRGCLCLRLRLRLRLRAGHQVTAARTAGVAHRGRWDNLFACLPAAAPADCNLARKPGAVERMALRLLRRVGLPATAQLMCWAVCGAEGSCVEEAKLSGAAKKGGFLTSLFKKKRLHEDVPDLPPCASPSECLDALHAHHTSFEKVLPVTPPLRARALARSRVSPD